ncbi:MAG: fibronectin type III domain-containing protein [Actinobacteria bacterium]|nr:fibronectin type III domain-containing protein [Actinomycetota bacterium]
MSREPDLEFGEAFWRDVYRRAGHVRELAQAELVAAEEKVLGEEAEVLPLFTEPFWNGINQRSERVRAMAARDLKAAEDRLVADKQVVHRTSRRLSPQLWARAQGFALALLATLALLPQIAPVLSWADNGSAGDELVEIEGILNPDSPSTQESISDEAPATEGDAGGGANDESPPSNAIRAAQPQEQDSPGGEEGSAGATERVIDGESSGSSGEGGTAAAGEDGLSVLRSPDDVNVEVVGTTSVRVSWTDRSDDEVGFELQRDTGSSGQEQSRNVAENQTTFQWDGLEAGTSACFRVRAVGAAAPSKWAPDTELGYACADLPVPPSPSPPPQPSPEPSPTATSTPTPSPAASAP